MVLAAGLGTRLRPFSDILPKPLFPVLGISALEWAIRRLRHADADQIVVNTHYLAAQVQSFLQTAHLPVSIEISHETHLAGTGGGVALARKWLERDEYFVLHNSDAFVTGDLNGLIRRFEATRPAAMLMVTRDPSRPRDHVVGVGPEKGEMRIKTLHAQPGDGLQHYMYTGIGVFSRRIFDVLPQKPPSCLVANGLKPMIRAGLPVLAYPCDGTFVDIGTPRGLLQAQALALAHTPRIFLDLHMQPPTQIQPGVFCMDRPTQGFQTVPPVFIGRNVHIAEGCTLGPNAFIGNDVTIARDSMLRDCVVLDRSRIAGITKGPVVGNL